MTRYTMNIRPLHISFLVLLLLATATILSDAQVIQTGIIDGIVVDAQGGPVGGVFITITSTGVNAQKVSTISDFEGLFRVPGLPPGVYYVKADLEGYVQDGDLRVNLRVNQVQRVTVSLREGIEQQKQPPARMAFLNSLYDLPFREDLSTIPDTIFPVRLLWLRPEQLLSNISFFDDETGFEGLEQQNYDLSYEGLNLTDPYDGSYLADPRYLPFNRVEVQTRFLEPYTRNSSGLLNYRINDYPAGFHGAVAGTLLSDFYQASDLEAEDMRTENRYAGLIVGMSFNDDQANISMTSTVLENDYNYLVSPADQRLDRSVFSEIRFTTQLSPVSELLLRGLFINLEQENYNAVSQLRWDNRDAREDVAIGDTRTRRTSTFGLRYRQRLSENIVISYKGQYSSITNTTEPTADYLDQPTQRDSELGILETGSLSGVWQENSADRLDASADIEFFLDEITGTHQIQLGVEAAYVENQRTWGYNGGVLREVRDDRIVSRTRLVDVDGEQIDPQSNGILTRFSIFARDNWLIDPRIMVNIGIRFDGTDIENSTTRVIDWNAVSPRLAVSFDAFNDGSLIARIGGGRYFDQARFQWSLPDPYAVNVGYDYEMLRRGGYIDRNDIPDRSSTNQRYGFDANWRPADTDTDPPRTDEVFASLEYSPSSDFRFSVDYNWRETKNILEDMDYYSTIDGPVYIGEFYLFAERNARDSNGTQYKWYRQLPRPDDDYNQELFWGNDDRLFRTFNSFSVRAEAALTDQFVMRGRYTWSSVRGNIDVLGEDITSHSTSQNTPNAFVNAEGYLSSDIRHIARLIGSYRFTDSTVLVMGNYRSGAPYDRLLFNPAFYSLIHEIRADPRGEAYRYDDLFTIDARYEHTFDMDAIRMLLGVEVANLLDTRAVTLVDTRDLETFGQPLAYNSPRSVRFDLQIQF